VSSQTIQLKNATEERVIEAAVQLFARNGFRGSSTKAIAQLAGVHEVTLFRHFPSKSGLFWSAMESQLSRLKLSSELLLRLEGREHPRTVLPSVIEFLDEKICGQTDLCRLLYVFSFEVESRNNSVLASYLGNLLNPIYHYLARCAGEGRLRCSDPAAATLGLLASLLIFQMAPDLLALTPRKLSEPVSPVACCTTLWLEVLLVP
jgi:AcrR family transcriptional regulator